MIESVIFLKISLNCGMEQAFEMFTENNLLESWLTEKADVEPKIGGKFELFWDSGNPENNSTIGCKITGIETNKYISFDWKGPVQFQHFMNSADPLTHVIIFLTPSVQDKKTIIYFYNKKKTGK